MSVLQMATVAYKFSLESVLTYVQTWNLKHIASMLCHFSLDLSSNIVSLQFQVFPSCYCAESIYIFVFFLFYYSHVNFIF
jgi:hypothetical protein